MSAEIQYDDWWCEMIAQATDAGHDAYDQDTDLVLPKRPDDLNAKEWETYLAAWISGYNDARKEQDAAA